MNVVIICQGLFFFSCAILSHYPNSSDCTGSWRVLLSYLFIYLVGIGFAEVENWQQVWKVANQFTVLWAS